MSKWDSVLVQGQRASAEALAGMAQTVIRNCPKAIDVRFHVMHSECCRGVRSLEITAFANRPLAAVGSCLQSIAGSVFAGAGLIFRTADVLMAHAVSIGTGSKAVYFHANDAYGSLGYIAFDAGKVVGSAFARWMGDDRVFVDGTQVSDPIADEWVLDAGFTFLGADADGRRMDALFDWFYDEADEHRVFRLMDKRSLVVPPREDDDGVGE